MIFLKNVFFNVRRIIDMFILPFIELICKSFIRKKGRHAKAAEKGVQVRPAAEKGIT